MRQFYTLLIWVPLLALGLQSCADKETDLDDPSSVADFICEKTQAMLDIAEENDLEKVAELKAEVQEMEEKVKARHGESFSSFMSEMETALIANCELSSPNIMP